MCNEASACRSKQTTLRVELRKVHFFVLTSLPEVDAQLAVVLEWLHGQLGVRSLHSRSDIRRCCPVVQPSHHAQLGCHHSVYLLLLLLLLLLGLIVSMLQVVSLLRGI